MSYGTQKDIENVFGADNVRRWSNLDNVDNTTDVARVQLAMLNADAEIQMALSDGPYSLPLSGMDLYSTNYITTLWARLAGIWLYENRGQKDDGEEGETGGRYSKMARRARTDLKMIRCGVTRLVAAKRWPVPTSPVALGGFRP